MAAGRRAAPFDRDLAHLSPAERWAEWLRRIEAVLFASAAPVEREALARVVGQGASVEALIEDLRIAFADRPCAVETVGAGWALRTRPAYAAAIRAAADLGEAERAPSETDMTVLAAIAVHQPITRKGLGERLGVPVNREIVTRLRARGWVAPGPRSPEPGAPRSFVTTEAFLDAFGLESLRDLDALPSLDDDGPLWPPVDGDDEAEVPADPE